MSISLVSWVFFVLFAAVSFSIHSVSVSGQYCQSDQQELLLGLKNSLNYTLSVKLANWNQSTDCCSWDGVSCDAGGLVIELDLSNNFIMGEINSSCSLFRLRYLQRLNLAFNNFISFPSGFDKLANLIYLDLSDNDLRGKVPEEILQVPTLQTLNLSGNYFLEGPLKQFSPNASFQELRLSDTNIGGELPESIGNLGQLTELDLSNCKFKGPIPETIGKLRQLVHLDFSSNNFSGPIPSFTSLRNLEVIKLADNHLDGSIGSTNWSSLVNLVTLDLQNNSFTGTIPPTLFRSSSLEEINLSKNQFYGGLDLDEASSGIPSKLTSMDISSNNLQGPFPMFVFEIEGLTRLSLSWNNFSGSISLSPFQNLRNLVNLDLSYNNVSIDSSASLPYFPNISTLMLASCNLTEFPDFLKSQFMLEELDLSSNQIHGEIPNWIWKRGALSYLNLSMNFLVEFEGPNFQMNAVLMVADFHGNKLQGQIPIFPQSIYYLDFSNNNFSSVLPPVIGDHLNSVFFSGNNFHGSIPASICNNSYLEVLDLSNNSLSGPIPQCLIQMTGALSVLNLRLNNLSGIISDTFPENCSLLTLDLNGNLLGGKVPKSLANCRMLEFLNLGNNRINDTFPCHLKDTVMLRVLILRSNKFNGDIFCEGNNITWPMLQAIDLASNHFSGSLPQGYLMAWDSMKANEDEPYSKHLQFESRSFVSDFNHIEFHPYFQDAMTVTIKGVELEVVKILTIFTFIDFSCNKFEGPIPEAIGELKAIHGLNLSLNALTSAIPPSLGKLRQLESLDLSSNHLIGQIPPQLADLNFLSFLNVSNNKLVGRIPKGTQLQSFPNASFEKNAGLCGPPLEVKCQSSPATGDSPSNSKTGNRINWNIVSVEIGFISGLGVVIAPLIFWRRWRIWYFRHIDRVLLRFFPRLVLKNRNHGRRASRSQRRQ